MASNLSIYCYLVLPVRILRVNTEADILIPLNHIDVQISTHLCRVESSTLTFRQVHFLEEGESDCFLLLQYFIKFHAFDANSVEPDLTPCSAASDLGLHYLPMSLLWDTRHKSI